MFRHAPVALFALLATPALADIDRSVLLDTADWQVSHEYFVETGGEACAASTENAFGDVLDVTAWPNGDVTLYLFMAEDFDGWTGAFAADAVIEIDAARWTLEDTQFRPQTIEFSFAGEAHALAFLAQLHEAGEVALMSPDGSAPLVAWSFADADRAVAGLGTCHDRIRRAAPLPEGVLG